MNPLPQNPTKAQEIEHFRAFVAQLPRASYLRSILADAPECVSQMIANDFAFPLIAELRKAETEAAQLADRLKTLQARADYLKNEAQEAERRTAKARDELADIRRAAASLARG